MTQIQEQRCGEILKHYGVNAQRRQLVEECAELIQAAMKLGRANDSTTFYNFIEEIADVEIMLEQMKQTLTDGERDTLLQIQTAKINRQLQRIAREDK